MSTKTKLKDISRCPHCGQSLPDEPGDDEVYLLWRRT